MSLTSKPLDRQATTPFFLKLFYQTNAFHHTSDFTPTARLPPHLQIYTWPTCTLRELAHLLTTALPHLLPSPAAGTRIAFRLVYPDTRGGGGGGGGGVAPGRYAAKDLGSVVVGAAAASSAAAATTTMEQAAIDVAAAENLATRPLAGDPDRTLADARFVIGDYVSCAVFAPGSDGAVAPAPAPVMATTRAAYGVAGGQGGGGGGGGYAASGMREDGGYRARDGGGPRSGGFAGDFGRGPSGGGGAGGGGGGGGGVPFGEWRRGERIPDGSGSGYRGGGGGGYPPRGRVRGRGW